MVGVDLRFHRPKVITVLEVITLIVATKCTSTFGISAPLICTINIGFLGSPYLKGIDFQRIISDKLPMT